MQFPSFMFHQHKLAAKGAECFDPTVLLSIIKRLEESENAVVRISW